MIKLWAKISPYIIGEKMTTTRTALSIGGALGTVAYGFWKFQEREYVIDRKIQNLYSDWKERDHQIDKAISDLQHSLENRDHEINKATNQLQHEQEKIKMAISFTNKKNLPFEEQPNMTQSSHSSDKRQ
jgi:uncharacterized protein YlxW (UPF0749 family)